MSARPHFDHLACLSWPISCDCPNGQVDERRLAQSSRFWKGKRRVRTWPQKLSHARKLYVERHGATVGFSLRKVVRIPVPHLALLTSRFMLCIARKICSRNEFDQHSSPTEPGEQQQLETRNRPSIPLTPSMRCNSNRERAFDLRTHHVLHR